MCNWSEVFTVKIWHWFSISFHTFGVGIQWGRKLPGRTIWFNWELSHWHNKRILR